MSDTKLVVFDINDTLIHDNSWKNMNMALGMSEEEDRLLWQLNQEGIITNDVWVRIVNALYQKRGLATRNNIENAILNYTYIDGAKDCIRTLQEAGLQVALLSGSVHVLVEHIADELGIRIYKSSSQLFFTPDDKLGKMTYLDEEAKAKIYDLTDICRHAEVGLSETVCVGDGANELELFLLTRGITFKGSQLADKAWKVVPSIKDVAHAILQA